MAVIPALQHHQGVSVEVKLMSRRKTTQVIIMKIQSLHISNTNTIEGSHPLHNSVKKLKMSWI